MTTTTAQKLLELTAWLRREAESDDDMPASNASLLCLAELLEGLAAELQG